MAGTSLDGAVVMVTGAGSGIGAAVAQMLAARGAHVICIGRNPERLGAVVGLLAGHGHALALDITDPASSRDVLQRLPEPLRAVDVLINNAGHDLGGRQRFDQGDADDWASIIETNVTGLIRLTHAIVPGMLERGRGHIVNLGSTAGLRVYPGGTIYNASKFAVRAFSDALRMDYADTDLRVTEILPGLTRTGFARARQRGDQAAGDAFYDVAPMTLTPEDVARTLVYALEQPQGVTIAQLVVVPTRT